MADAADSKSADGDIVRVQVPSSAPLFIFLFFVFLNYSFEKSEYSYILFEIFYS